MIDELRKEVARLEAIVEGAAADKAAQASSIRAAMEAKGLARERQLQGVNSDLRNTIAALEAKVAAKAQSRRDKVAKVRRDFVHSRFLFLFPVHFLFLFRPCELALVFMQSLVG